MTKSVEINTQCHVCGSSRSENVYVDEVFKVNGRHVLVEHIPAQRCRQCGELTFDSTTTERVRVLLHESPLPARSITLDVFDLAIA